MRLPIILLFPALLQPLTRPAHAAQPFKHIILIVQENRTPDNLFGSNPGFEPGVDIATAGVNSAGKIITLRPTALDGCYDISHTHSSFEASLTQGADQDPVQANAGCVVPANPQFRYVDNAKGTVQPYFDIAAHYGFANRMFQTNQGPSFPAHQFIFGATSAPSADSPLFAAENMADDRKGAGCTSPASQTVAVVDASGSETSNKPVYPCFNRPTLTTLLDEASPPISWRYYSPSPTSIWTAPNALSGLCQPRKVDADARPKCTGPEWVNNVVADNPAQVLADIGDCKLAGVSWVIPTGANSDHAAENAGTGPAWVASIVNAVGLNKTCAGGERYWNDTAILITWDDWGGWYDHVKPFQINVRPPLAWGDGYTYGFRVPLLVVSAYTPAGFVGNGTLDFGSLIYFIERNFGLGFIGPGTSDFANYADYHAAQRGDLADFFTLAQARAFEEIPSSVGAAYFLKQPHSPMYPDDD